MLDNLAIFFGDDPAVLKSAKELCTTVSFPPSATILTQEESSKSVYCLLLGQAKALMFSEDGDEIWLDEFGPGALFGEMAVLGANHRTADIVATSRVTVAAFSEENFLQLMEKHGSVGIKVSRLLVKRIQQTTRRMFDLTAFSAKGRVYAELLRLSKKRKDGKITIERLPQFTTIAQRISSTRETVSRAVNDLERKGIVIRQKYRMIILKPEELHEMQTN